MGEEEHNVAICGHIQLCSAHVLTVRMTDSLDGFLGGRCVRFCVRRMTHGLSACLPPSCLLPACLLSCLMLGRRVNSKGI